MRASEEVGIEQGLGRLRDKSAVVTGAAKGIGRATTELFASEGARLVVTDVDEEGLGGLRYRLAEEVSEAEVASVVGDVSSPEDAKKIIGTCVERFGRIDVLVANAGVFPLSTKEGKPGMSPCITSDHIVDFEEKHGALKEGEVVLLQTGWNHYYVEGEKKA